MDGLILLGGLLAFILFGIVSLHCGKETGPLGEFRDSWRRDAENTP